MIEVLEHVNDDKKTIREIFRVLKPGGNLVITAPNRLFPFETHGFRIGSRNVATRGFGFPLLPYLPNCLRKYCANANVYSPKTLKKMLKEEGFFIQKISYLSPGLDQLKNNFPKYESHITLIQEKIDFLEHLTPLNIFLTTIIIHATRDN
jgi:SAM-dependent methyltransferase